MLKNSYCFIKETKENKELKEVSSSLLGLDAATISTTTAKTGHGKGATSTSTTTMTTNNNSNYDYDPKDRYGNKIYEMSSGAGGSVEGSAFGNIKKGPWVNTKFDESLFVERKSFLEELLLRENIREILKTYKKDLNEHLEEVLNCRRHIKYLIKETVLKDLNRILEEGKKELKEKINIKESKSKVSDAVHSSTGINVLEDLLKQIIPSLEQDYKSLTTNPEQRESFREHILNAVQKTIVGADINQQAGQDPNNLKETKVIPVQANEVDVSVGTDPNPDKFIDINKKPGDGEKKDTFSIPGKDETGRNMARSSYEKMEKQILDSFSMLSDPEDKTLFSDYLQTNIRMYCEKWESELGTDVDEPLTGNDIAQQNEPVDNMSSQKP